jgi:hypothetical protein
MTAGSLSPKINKEKTEFASSILLAVFSQGLSETATWTFSFCPKGPSTFRERVFLEIFTTRELPGLISMSTTSRADVKRALIFHYIYVPTECQHEDDLLFAARFVFSSITKK